MLSIPPKQLSNFGQNIKLKLNSFFSYFWKSQVQQCSSGKLRTYSKVKYRLNFEEYLHNICNVKCRLAVTRLRISAHRLPVETGRYVKIQYDDRKCNLCAEREIGDEFHYLMSCSHSSFVKVREVFINNLISINSDFHKFNTKDLFLYLLSMHDTSIMKLFAKFCNDILNIFKDNSI